MVVVRKRDGQCHDGKQTQEVNGTGYNGFSLLTRLQGLLVPDLTEADAVEADQARWVLVIEKEARVTVRQALPSLMRTGCLSFSCYVEFLARTLQARNYRYSEFISGSEVAYSMVDIARAKVIPT